MALGAAAYGQVLPEPRTIRINDRVYVLLGPIRHANKVNQGYMINSTVIVGDKGAILVDSGGSDEVGRHIAKVVRQITNKPARGARTETFVQGVRMVFWVPLGSHTIGDLLVYLPDDKVLVAGDVLVSGIVPTFQDGFIRNWLRTLDEILALDVAQFIPGHGNLMTRRDITDLRGAMLRFYSGVEDGYRSGKSEGEIRKSLDLSSWDRLERSYVIGRNINRAYLEIEAASFDK